MRLAVLGDVHANHLALRAVLDAARDHGVDQLLVTGDLVGYYFWPRETLELLGAWKSIVVRGNHEDMLCEARRKPETLDIVERKYGSGLRIALDTLSEPQLRWLEDLPHPLELSLDGRRIQLCHGTPWDVDEYLYPDAAEEKLARCASGQFDWVLLGHTHYAMERQHGHTRIVNPGSVGQPRDRKPGAHWALLDTEKNSIAHHCESYDTAWIADQCQRLQPEMPYLWKVLTRV